MERELSRRTLLYGSTVATVSIGGCLDAGIGGQPESVSFEVVNHRDRSATVVVEFAASDSNDVLLAETVEVPGDGSRGFDVGPIDHRARYTVEYAVGGQSGESSLSGSGLRGVEVRLDPNGAIEVSSTAS